MSEEFTKTELMTISLVLSQNADEYGDPMDDEYQQVKEISKKARRMMGQK